MYIIEVIPIQHLPKNVSQVLTYFHKDPLEQGALVEISVSHQNLLGIVASSTALDKVKNEIKSSSFKTKKIKKIVSEKPITSKSFWKIAQFISTYYFDDLTRVVKTLLPKNIPSIIKYLEKNSDKTFDKITNIAIDHPSIKSIIADGTIIKIQNTIQNNQSILIAFSTNADLLFFKEHLSHIFNEQLFITVDDKLTQKNQNQYYLRLLNNQPSIIFSLRKGLGLPLDNLGLTMVFNSNDDSFKSWDMRPYYNFETVLKWYSKNNHIEILYHKDAINLCYHKLIKDNPKTFDLQTTSKDNISTKIIYSDLFKNDQEILSGTFKQGLKDIEENKWIFFVNKKGYHSGLYCQKCGYTFVCPKCKKPLTYYQNSKNNYFLCNVCNSKFHSHHSCPRCQNQSLQPISHGLDKLNFEIKNLLKNTSSQVLSIDSSIDQSCALEKINKFNNLHNAILIGTSSMLKPQLLGSNNTVALYLDNLFFLPDFKTEEKILTILLKLKNLSHKNFYIKTTIKDHPLFEIIKTNDFESFWKTELMLRKKYGFPPYSQITLITNKNKNSVVCKEELEQAFTKIQKTIVKNNLEKKFILTPISQNFVDKINNQYLWNFKIKMIFEKPMSITTSDIKMRNQLLKTLPNHFYIDVDPINSI